MPRDRAHALGQFAEQLACADAKGKAKLDASGNGGTHKDGARLKQGAESSEVIIMNGPSEEEYDSDCFSEEDWSADESDWKSEKLMDQIAQIESDKVFARPLQEALNREIHNSETEREEHSIRIQMNCAVDSLYLNGEHFSLQMPYMENANLRRTETRFSGPVMEYEMWLLSELRKELGRSQDSAKTAELWKELDTIYENQSDVDMSDSFYPNYYDDMYEDGPAVDEIVGTTDSQINNLPVSTVKGDQVEDKCAICLEAPFAGAIVRHLPCMHRLHKECIDTWLRIRSCCPICKVAIN